MDPTEIENKISGLFKSDPESAFKALFDAYFSYLCAVVYRMIPDKSLAEDLTQDVFYDMWRKKDSLIINTSYKAYLRRASVNRTLNYIRDNKIKFEEESEAQSFKSLEVDILQKLNVDDLQNRINEAIGTLPDRCRIIFSLSRFEELSYKEIAENLGISVKTVENQMSKALRILRNHISKRKNE